MTTNKLTIADITDMTAQEIEAVPFKNVAVNVAVAVSEFFTESALISMMDNKALSQGFQDWVSSAVMASILDD